MKLVYTIMQRTAEMNSNGTDKVTDAGAPPGGTLVGVLVVLVVGLIVVLAVGFVVGLVVGFVVGLVVGLVVGPVVGLQAVVSRQCHGHRSVLLCPYGQH